MRQSSIEWLMEIDKSYPITLEEWKQAMAIHKTEIAEAYLSGFNDGDTGFRYNEDYHKETFGSGSELVCVECGSKDDVEFSSVKSCMAYCKNCRDAYNIK